MYTPHVSGIYPTAQYDFYDIRSRSCARRTEVHRTTDDRGGGGRGQGVSSAEDRLRYLLRVQSDDEEALTFSGIGLMAVSFFLRKSVSISLYKNGPFNSPPLRLYTFLIDCPLSSDIFGNTD